MAPASEDTEYVVDSVPVKGMVTMISIGRKTCAMCKRMGPILDTLREEYKEKAAIVFIDLRKYPERQYIHKIKALPTQIFFDANGEEVFRHTGFMGEGLIVAQLNKMGVE